LRGASAYKKFRSDSCREVRELVRAFSRNPERLKQLLKISAFSGHAGEVTEVARRFEAV
jgi:hypothetical protein